jgi:hypothetical protein
MDELNKMKALYKKMLEEAAKSKNSEGKGNIN